MLLDPRNGPLFDHPAHPHPRCWALASVPRSGSTLLCRTLWDLSDLGAPKEYVNPMQIRDWAVRFGSLQHRAIKGPLLGVLRWPSQRFLRSHLDRVILRRTARTGWFGIKIHHHHFQPVLQRWLTPTWIRIIREDKVAQAVSWARALQTGQWAAHQRAHLPPVYSRRRIRRCLQAISRQEHSWDTFFRSHEVVPHEVLYSDLVSDLSGTIDAVYSFLGESGPSRPIVPGLERQADDVSALWVDRYRRGL